ncbi:MAG TPA: hypothetical protein EYM39_04785 [Candidatus Latescibacteria bacterium]|nr:hypothetical protein [Candidatus Latescibacterota bacterium]
MEQPIIPRGCDDEYLIDYMFDLNGYIIFKGALDPDDLNEMNGWVDDHQDFVDGARRGHHQADGGQWIGHVETHTYSSADGTNFQNVIEAGPVFRKLINYPAWYADIQRWINPMNRVSIHENLVSIRGKGGYIGIHCGGHLPINYMTFRQNNTGEWMVGQINCIMAMTDIGPGDGPTTLIPGSHKARIAHPQLSGGTKVYRSDEAAGKQIGMREIYAERGDVLMFTDTITHGSAERTNEGYRRMCLYRYSPRWIRSRFHYVPSPELLAALTDEQRDIIQPIPPRYSPSALEEEHALNG